MPIMYIPAIGKVRRPAMVALAAAGILAVGGLGVYIVNERRTEQIDTEALTVPVESQPLAVRITASGTVEAVDSVNLSPRTSDVITDIYVEQGDRVADGQVIARMKSSNVEAEIAQAEARIAQLEANLAELRAGSRPEEIARAESQVRQAEAQVADAQARLKLAEDRVARNQSLYDEGAIALDDLDASIQEQQRARASLSQTQAGVQEAQDNLRQLRNGSRAEDIAAAEAQLQEARAQLQGTQVRLDDTVIRAPFAGIITQKFATEGSFVTPTTSASEASSATSSAIVALAKGLQVVAEVPEVDIGEITPGQTVEIVADAYPDQTFEGRVERIAPEAIEDRSRGDFTYFEVVVELVSGQDTLKSGMKTDVTFIGDELSDALVVPSVAIVSKDGQPGVLVTDEEGEMRLRRVTLGSQVGNQIQILEGVDSGDRIFLELPEGKTLENLNFGQREAE
ncbi:MAG: efflux RND transporter periplasmic adaptor subunit [Cyanobacteria bacterium P01_A01_bin.135]